MKKSLLVFLLTCQFVIFNSFVRNQIVAQTASVTITIGAYTNQCCTGNTVPYTCFGCGPPTCTGCYNSSNTITQTFTDPIPAGNVLTGITVNYYTIGGVNNTLVSNVNGESLGTGHDGNSGSDCSTAAWGVSGSSSASYPCGFTPSGSTSYTYGGTNTFNLTVGGQVCINKAVLIFSYGSAATHGPPVQPAVPSGPTSVCAGTAYTYSIPATGNTTGYTWTVPSGWTINSGQNTTSINVTAGSTTGGVCVNGTNGCGAGLQSCLTVSVLATSTAPTSASANPTTMCSGTSTLTVSGGSLGTGASWHWYSGGCNGTAAGTGSSITVSPSSTTTYYVNAVGTCNTTACTPVTVNIGGTTATPGAPTGSTSMCGGTTQTYNTTGTIGATSYVWTVPSGGTINSGQGTTSISATLGSSSGNVCVSAVGACGTSAAACSPITITSVPITPGSISGPASVCIGSDNYSISTIAGATGYVWATTGGGTITNGSTATATINWTTPGTYTLSVIASNACGNSTQSALTVTVNPPPTITINSSTLTVCSGSSATFTASGANTYTWTPGAAVSPTTGSVVSATPLVSPTVYTVNATDGNGCVNANTISISVNSTPTVSISGGGGNSQTVCGGGLVNSNVAAINFTVTPSGSVVWTNTNTTIGLGATGTGSIGSYPAPNITSGASTTAVITATATSGGCASTNSTLLTYTLTINQIPGSTTATINPANCGTNNGTISGPTGTGGSGFYSYSWDNGGTFTSTSSYTNGAGTYPVEIKDNTTGCIYSQNFTIPNAGAPAAPAVTASSTIACIGGSIILSVTAPVSGTTYNWTEANGNTGAGTTYTIVSIPASPNPYTIGVSGTSLGCTGSANTTSITVSPLPPAPVLTAPTGTNNAYCQGSPMPLTVSSGTATPTPIAVWYSGSTMVNVGNSFTPPANLSAGTYTYSVIDSIPAVNGCVNAPASANTVTLSVTVNPTPPAPILTAPTGTNNAYCQGLPTTLTVNSGTNTAVWYSGNTVVNTGSSFTPPANLPAGTYTYSVIDSIPAVNGCVNAPASANTVTLSVTVNSLPPAPVLTAPTGANNSYCQGFPSPLTVNTSTNMAVWYSGNAVVNTGSSYTAPANLPAGTYTYSVIDSIPAVNGCINAPQSANTVTLTLVINPNPSIDVSGALSDTAKCGQPTGGVHGIANATGGTPYIHYQWTGPGTTAADTLVNLSNISSGGSYSLQITDANGCHASGTGLAGVNTFSVPSVANPVASFSTSPSPAAGSVPLTIVFTNQSTGITSSTGYVWDFGDASYAYTLSPTHTYTAANTYTATLIAYNGSCASSPATVLIIADVPTTIIIPNIFSPNGDDKNDEFFIVNTGMSSLNCQIFNRWGQLMHTLTAPGQSWDGFTPNGDKAPEGTYMFILQAQGTDGKTYKQQGTLTLVR